MRSALLFIFLFSINGHAIELFEMNKSVRALGMGNAYTSIVRDSDSLFYNPAGLNSVKEWKLEVLTVGLGITSLSCASFIIAATYMYQSPTHKYLGSIHSIGRRGSS